MKALPEGLDERDVRVGLDTAWGFDAATVEYHPEGFGSYHWIVGDGAGARRFVTVDDLDDKPWLGSTRETAFAGLRRAFDTAFALQHRAHLPFVLAPLLTRANETVVRVGERHSMALHPIAPGHSAGFGDRPTPDERLDTIRALVQLHRATPLVQGMASNFDLAVPGRRHLEQALAEVDGPWEGGPFSETARTALARHRLDVVRLLEVFDDIAREVEASAHAPVITHGEPHEGNIMRDAGTLVLVDWDTVGLALPERDLWIIDGITEAELDEYAESAGRAVDPKAMNLYRMRWDLGDIAAYVRALRSDHRDTPDTRHASTLLDHYLRLESRWATFLG